MSLDRAATIQRVQMSTVTQSKVIGIAGIAWGLLHLPSNWAAGNITWHVWNPITESFVVPIDDQGTAVPDTAVTSGNSVYIPQVVAAAGKFRLVSSVNQEIGREFGIEVKR